MNIQNVRRLIAAGAATLVMGLGGNLYATSYTMSDYSDFGTGPPSNSARVDFNAELLFCGHDSYRQVGSGPVFSLLRQVAAKYWGNQQRIGRAAALVPSSGMPAPTQSIASAVIEPLVTTTTVPDGGDTVLLLGGALCGLAVLRRRVRV